MHIAAFWSKATAEETTSDGQRRRFSCWRSSDASVEDAKNSASEAATRILRKWLRGGKLDRYGYGNMPLREEVVQRFTDDSGATTAAVTRNGYGALVLNTARAMFVDIDFPEVGAGAGLSRLVGRLLGKKQPSIEEQNESQARERVESFAHANPASCMRLYRTHSGLRLLMTHEPFAPAAKQTQSCFAALGADPLYVRLCNAQDSFRARLTPKPWRCGLWQARVAWPRETTEEQAAFDKWQAEYSLRQTKYAICRYLATLGDAPVHPEIETILEVHDHLTRCKEPLPLA